jgi:hypothetical protein
MALDGAPTPWHTCQISLGSEYRTSPTNCDDPIHGSAPGEIYLVVQDTELLVVLLAIYLQGTEQVLPTR